MNAYQALALQMAIQVVIEDLGEDASNAWLTSHEPCGLVGHDLPADYDGRIPEDGYTVRLYGYQADAYYGAVYWIYQDAGGSYMCVQDGLPAGSPDADGGCQALVWHLRDVPQLLQWLRPKLRV